MHSLTLQYVTVTWMLPVSPTFDCLGLSDRRIFGCWPNAASAAQPFLIFFSFFFLSRQPSLSLSFEPRVEDLLSQLMCANDHLFFTYVGILE